MTSRWSKTKSSRLAEFRDCDAEWRETGNKDAAVRRFLAMRKHTEKDFERAQEIVTGRIVDNRERTRALARKYGIEHEQRDPEALTRRKGNDNG